VDSIEWNKFAGWTLAAFLAMMILGWASSSVFHHERQEKPAYAVEGCDGDRTCGAGEGEVTVAVAAVPLPNLLAAATAEKGEALFKQCTTCHGIEKGGAAKTGPNLWGVIGSNHAKNAGFAYSAGLAAKSGEKWTWEAMDAWLTNPKKAIPGNKMSFGGISNPEKRAALLMYLNKNSDAPMAIPAPVAVSAPADAKAPVVANAVAGVEIAKVPVANATDAKPTVAEPAKK
jgi:cytochrome c